MAYNDPVGSTQLVNHAFNDFSAFYFGSGQLVSDPTAPVSPQSVFKNTLPARAATGGSQLNLSIGNPRTDMYCRINWRTNAGFQGRTAQDKLFFMRGPNSNGFFGLLGGPTKGGPFRFYFGHNSGNVNNDHTMSDHLGLIGYPNVGSGVIIPGVWTILEAYIKRSTTLTSRDGIVKWWVNGFPAGSYTNINYGPAGLNEWIWTETWDGCGNNGADCDIGPSARGVNTVEWSHFVDHLYISSGGTLVDGGTNPPPPDPDPDPPPQVVLQSITPPNLSTVIGTTKQFTISMSGPVASATSLFTLSSNPSVATVPASVTIAQGASTALVTATPVAIGSTTISTSYNNVTKGATLQVGTSGTTTGSTEYDYSAQFSGVQGQDNWYYLENNGTQMTYNAGTEVWVGTDGGFQTIWANGFHPGNTRATVLRFVVPTSGVADIVGSTYDYDTGGGFGAVSRVNHNGLTLFSRTIANGATTGGEYSLEDVPVAAGDFIEFVVDNVNGDPSHNSTALNPVITLSETSTVPDPPPPPDPPASVVDFFIVGSGNIVVGSTFTMTVRVSKLVTVDTAVEIRVGSTSILTAPTSVTVLTGTSEINLTVTPLAASIVAIEAILNGTRRVTLTVLPVVVTPPVIDPGPGTNPDIPPSVAVTPTPDGARLLLNQPAKAIGFRYDAQADYAVIGSYTPGALSFTHTFTWPSGTTTICYRAQSQLGEWAAGTCVPFEAPIPPIPPTAVNKAVIDKDGIRWQLSGKKSPYILKRNGSSMDNTYGVMLRKSSDGYMELLQSNAIWIRRNGNAWEFVE